jgi:hypothetical protein
MQSKIAFQFSGQWPVLADCRVGRDPKQLDAMHDLPNRGVSKVALHHSRVPTA